MDDIGSVTVEITERKETPAQILATELLRCRAIMQAMTLSLERLERHDWSAADWRDTDCIRELRFRLASAAEWAFNAYREPSSK